MARRAFLNIDHVHNFRRYASAPAKRVFKRRGVEEPKGRTVSLNPAEAASVCLAARKAAMLSPINSQAMRVGNRFMKANSWCMEWDGPPLGSRKPGNRKRRRVGGYFDRAESGSSLRSRGGRPLRIGYDTYNVFQRYWWGQADPLYAVLSRRGGSVDWVTVKASSDERARMCETAHEATRSDDAGERRVGKAYLKRHSSCRRM